jgi:hypothetical protein
MPTPCLLSAAAYSIYWQLPSIAGGCLLLPRPGDALAVVTRGPPNMGSKQYKWESSEQHIIIEQSMEYLTNLYLMFVDFEKAFDSINRNKMWEIMNRYGIS